MAEFDAVLALAGGAIFGLGSVLLLIFNGRIAGVSGIVSGLLFPVRQDWSWRAYFAVGMLLGGFALSWLQPQAFIFGIERSNLAIIAAGILIGVGARMANGCTSGHFICGIGRLSRRSIVAGVIFAATATVVVFLVNRVFGGAL
ncbi:MAG: YeeE/YedE thiosulfate transporter family protein [bacterium]